MEQIVSLLGYDFVQNAFAAGLVIAIVSGVVSRFVVARNMSFAVHALSELGFTGAAGFILLRLSPVLGLLAGTAVTAVFIGALGVRARGRDVVIGVVMAFGLGLGVLFITLYKGYANQAFAILFGTITGVSRGDVALLVAIGVVTIATLAFIYRPLTFATVDPEVAEARGVPVGPLAVVFLLIMAAAVAEAIQVVGVLLILTLLITPGASAERLTPRPGAAVAWSVAIALFCVLGGILLSLATNAPVSVFVTSLSFACYLVTRFVVGPRRRELRAIASARADEGGATAVASGGSADL
jgi:zinc/manganese transport system permease protein